MVPPARTDPEGTSETKQHEAAEQLAAAAGELTKASTKKLKQWLTIESAAGFREMELEVAGLARAAADRIVELVLRARVEDSDFEGRCSKAARRGRRESEAGETLRSGARREVSVTMLGGSTVRVRVGYLRPDLSGRSGPRRGTGRRGAGGAGLYPVLAALGIWFGVTPGLADEITRQVTDSDSVRSGRAALARRGIDLGHKQTLRIVNGFGQRAVEQRSAWIARRLEAAPTSGGPLKGQRVVIGIDGGRIRERVQLGGRRNAKTGHHRFEAPWREPKLFTIYVVDNEGKGSEIFRPVYDGTMEDCDAVFRMLAGYLRALGAQEAKELIVVGDGAKWIWERVGPLTEAIGIEPEKVRQIVDWFHAVETIEKVADARAQWPEGEHAKWVKRAKDYLYAGDTAGLMAHFDGLGVGRRATVVNKHRDYFESNTARMQYRAFAAAGLPCGSGAIESAIRRVINLRMKGNGTFWRIENAEAMLMLRGYLKAGRFDDLVDWSMATAADWWAAKQAPLVEMAATR